MQNIFERTLLFEPWLKYKTPIVRQLAFSVASPNILSQIPDQLHIQHAFELHHEQEFFEHFLAYEKRLTELDNNPTPLLEFLKQLKSTRLGLRFEYLFWFWLLDDTYHHYQLIGHSIQIIEGANTLGELDFLILNKKTQEIEHWEVALKYYLAEHDLALQHWYGLNRTDTLLRKLTHFSHQQFKFNYVKNHEIDRRFAIMKGQLYLPTNAPNNALPLWVNSERRIGTWGNETLKDFYRLQRQEWICPDWQQSSPPAYWWTDGLYHNRTTQQFYMFRNTALPYVNC
ncbi:DUF1853 family protein [Acinetobacter gerneri]|uniref:DUF1853 family protein n=1 Tax=Acinetobacter gerneri TaxID=202952 RepID=UPI002936A930|nr:DUF1853 family protein [Acinetobacter gerneri]MDV2441916.1 DUF1853 family protein [Acinetobacter gerneri]